MVVHQPEPMLPCCSLGFVVKGAYKRARARHDAAEQAGPDQGVWDAYVAMLIALVNWCEHELDAHGSDPGPVDQCLDCARFEESGLGKPGFEGLAMTAEEWAYERRVHQIAHRLAPRIKTLMGDVVTEPPGTAMDNVIPFRLPPADRPGPADLLVLPGAARTDG
ncbi:hypothetical protein [Streptomyces roseolus]|uniref:hypothetical protein n=1 Tax=Streptomyces roseolus TaxID=67358 RepID=UPI0037BBDFC3